MCRQSRSPKKAGVAQGGFLKERAQSGGRGAPGQGHSSDRGLELPVWGEKRRRGLQHCGPSAQVPAATVDIVNAQHGHAVLI